MNLESLGHAAERLQVDPGLIETGLKANEAAPKLTLNGLRYWQASDVDKAAKWIAETERECLTR